MEKREYLCDKQTGRLNRLKYDFLFRRKVALFGSPLFFLSFLSFYARITKRLRVFLFRISLLAFVSAHRRNGYSRDKGTKSLSRWPGGRSLDRSGTVNAFKTIVKRTCSSNIFTNVIYRSKLASPTVNCARNTSLSLFPSFKLS